MVLVVLEKVPRVKRYRALVVSAAARAAIMSSSGMLGSIGPRLQAASVRAANALRINNRFRIKHAS